MLFDCFDVCVVDWSETAWTEASSDGVYWEFL